MDSLELLQILDVIRNEKLYNERLEKLRVEEEKARENKLIAATLELAQKRLQEAKDLVGEAEEKAKKIVAEAEQAAKLRMNAAVEKDAALAIKEGEFLAKQMEAQEKWKEARRLRDESLADRKALQDGWAKLAEQEKETRRIKAEYGEKMESLRKVMGV